MSDASHPPTEPTAGALRRWRRRLADERAEGAIYRRLARRRSGDERDILLGLAEAEARHARHWENLLGPDAGPPRPARLRMRLLAWLAGRFGSVFVLALVYRARAMPEDQAHRLADDQIRRRSIRPAHHDAGVDGHDVVGTAMKAAVSSFCFFAIGAAIPVLPYLFGLTGLSAMVVALVLVSLALILTGSIVGVLSGGPPLRRGLRQLVIGLGAAAVTYLLGLVFGATVG